MPTSKDLVWIFSFFFFWSFGVCPISKLDFSHSTPKLARAEPTATVGHLPGYFSSSCNLGSLMSVAMTLAPSFAKA